MGARAPAVFGPPTRRRLIATVTPLPVLAAALSLGPAPAQAAAPDAPVAVLLVITPPSVESRVSISTVLPALARPVTELTRLTLRSSEQAGVDPLALERCPPAERLGCWLRTAVPDLALDPAAPPPARAPAWLFVLAIHPQPGGADRFTMLGVDVALAIATHKRAAEGPASFKERLEESVDAATVRPRPVSIASGDLEAIQRAFRGMLEVEMRPALERAGLFGPPPPRIAESTPGEPPPAPPPPTEAAPPATPPDIDWPLAAGGAAVAIAGVVIGAIGLSRNAEIRSACLRRAAESSTCSPAGFATFGFDPDRLPAPRAEDANPSGLAIAPLGAALFAAGAGAGIASLVLPEQSRSPWVAVAIGVAAGAITYAVGEGLNPR